jgi:hypothetical protein
LKSTASFRGKAILDESDIEDKPYGGRGFACRDLEGRLRWVGTYDPWQHE